MHAVIVDLTIVVLALGVFWAVAGIVIAEAAIAVLAAMDEREGKRPTTARWRWIFRLQMAGQWWRHPAVSVRALSFGHARAKRRGPAVTSDEAAQAIRDFAESEQRR